MNFHLSIIQMSGINRTCPVFEWSTLSGFQMVSGFQMPFENRTFLSGFRMVKRPVFEWPSGFLSGFRMNPVFEWSDYGSPLYQRATEQQTIKVGFSDVSLFRSPLYYAKSVNEIQELRLDKSILNVTFYIRSKYLNICRIF